LIPGLAGAGPTDLQGLLERIDTESARTMAFEETRSSDLLEEEMVLTGQVRFEPPGRLERHVESPYRESQIILGNRVQIHRNNRRIGGFSLNRAPELRALKETLVGLLTRDADALLENFEVEMDETEEGDWSLHLVPRNPDVAAEVKWLKVAGHKDRVRSMTIEPVEGKRIETRLEPLE